MSLKGLKVGSDPEFFTAYEENGDLFVLPPVILRTDLHYPFEENDRHPIFFRHGDAIVHEDGAAFELGIPPSKNWKDQWNSINEIISLFEENVLSQFGGTCLPKLYALPAMHYQVERWAGRDDEFHWATRFGCDPDKDVYNIESACKVFDASTHPWRYAGGHIHFSGLKELEEKPLQAIRSLALTAGVAATAFSDVPDLERERLFRYGRPGKFRIQKYKDGSRGVEYRTPSTRWTSSIYLAEKVFSWAEIGLEYLLCGGLLEEIEPEIEKPAIEAMLTVNQDQAKEVLNLIASRV